MQFFGTIRNLLCGAAAGLVVFAAGGAAADGPRPYVVGVSDLQGATDWSGFYLGGQLGGAWANMDWTQLNANLFNTAGATVLGSTSSFNADGVLGGIVGGYNQQLGHWVFGLELAATGTDLSTSSPNPFFPAISTFSSEINWLATLAGRIGYAWDRWLVYGRGGWTGGDVKLTMTSTLGPVASKDTWANGWNAGGGVEYMFWRGVALGLDYQYVQLDLDGETLTCPACGVGVGLGTPSIDADNDIQSVMGRVTFYLTPED